MKTKLLIPVCAGLLLASIKLKAQNVQKWEMWQDNLFVTNTYANANPAQRNIGVNVWSDRGFGMELHNRSNTWGTAIYTRSSNEAIWMGNYGANQGEQQYFNPWMTLINGNVGIGNSSPNTKLEVTGDVMLRTGSTDGARLIFHGGAGGNQEYRARVAPSGSLAFFPGEGAASSLYLHQGSMVGIGIDPQAKLDMLTTVANDGFMMRHTGGGFIKMHSSSLTSGSWNAITNAGDAGIIFGSGAQGGGSNSNVSFGFVIAPWHNTMTGLRIDKEGNVGIATNDTKGYRFAVNGNAIFTRIKVRDIGSWPDYVFEPDYKLPTLSEVEQFIQKNKHLPDMPSAKEVGEKGIDVGDSQAGLLKKIEELTLYIIEMDKKIEAQQKEIENLKRK